MEPAINRCTCPEIPSFVFIIYKNTKFLNVKKKPINILQMNLIVKYTIITNTRLDDGYVLKTIHNRTGKELEQN